MTRISLVDRCALVTGSSMGIGRGIAMGLIEAGAQVLFHGLEGSSDDLPPGSMYLQADLTDSDAPEKLVRNAFEHVEIWRAYEDN